MQPGGAFLPVVATADRHLPQLGLRGHVHLPDGLSRGRGAAVPYRWQNDGRRTCCQRQAQEGPGRGIEAAGMVDQVARSRRACRTNALGAAPVPVRQLKRPRVHAVRDGAVWQDAMFEWIASFDAEAAAALGRKRASELEYILAYKKGVRSEKYKADYRLADHGQYFSLQDIRPAAITTKLSNRNADAYDFAAHANPSTTHTHYDRRRVKKAGATE